MGNLSRRLKRTRENRKLSSQVRPISSRLLELANPLLQELSPCDGSEEHISAVEEVMVIAVLAWNHFVVTEKCKKKLIRQSRRFVDALSEEKKRDFDLLYAHKRQHHSDDNRLVMDAEVIPTKKGFRIQAASAEMT